MIDLKDIHPALAESVQARRAFAEWLPKVSGGHHHVVGKTIPTAAEPLARLWASHRAKTYGERMYISKVFKDLAATSDVFKPIGGGRGQGEAHP